MFIQKKPFVATLDEVAQLFNVTTECVTEWRDGEGCVALNKPPYQIEAIEIWLSARARTLADPQFEQKLRGQLEDLLKEHSKGESFPRRVAAILASAAAGVAATEAYEAYEGISLPTPEHVPPAVRTMSDDDILQSSFNREASPWLSQEKEPTEELRLSSFFSGHFKEYARDERQDDEARKWHDASLEEQVAMALKHKGLHSILGKTSALVDIYVTNSFVQRVNAYRSMHELPTITVFQVLDLLEKGTSPLDFVD